MRAIVCSRLGTHADLEVQDVPEPPLAPGSVRIAMEAVSLNFPDLLMVQGLYQLKAEPPFVPGAEGAGIVLEVGANVADVAPGDRVMAVGLTGAFAEQWVVDAASVVPLPDSIDFSTGAALMLTYGTSYHALIQRATLTPDDTLLVLGAAGGVGSAAVDIAKAIGATVIAAASTDEKVEFCRSIGADATINYTTDSFRDRLKEITAGQGVDVVFDPVGGELSEQALRSIAWAGRYLVIGFASGDIPKIPLNLPLLKGASIVGVWWGTFTQREPDVNRENTAALFTMVEDGRLTPRITRTLPLEEHRSAFDLLASRSATGKVVMTIGADG
ncbi:Putative Zn-dependent oxidoreductase PA5234 [hydrothermal vent metagenome]|uniref:Zn-dependent oxidoreductase PA5234 n=1 Tax=hydrothermal vent metagenome TaxID=652676 RepID=A0A3B0TC26_9ZZZZ